MNLAGRQIPEILKQTYEPNKLLGIELITAADKVPYYSTNNLKAIKGFFKRGQKVGKITGYTLVDGFKSVYMFRTDKGYLIYLKTDWYDLAPLRKIKSKYDEAKEQEEKEEQQKIEAQQNTFWDRTVTKIVIGGVIILGMREFLRA